MTAAGGEPVYVEDVFRTFRYLGTQAAQDIENNIDLSTEGGLVWIKNRAAVANHYWVDTERGATKWMSSNNTNAEDTTTSTGLYQFNTNGFSINGTGSIFNALNNAYLSQTFRRAKGFFDIVTYTGNGVNGRTISHNLGTVPGCIIVKRRDSGGDWRMYHRGGNNGSSPENYGIRFGTTTPETTGYSFMNNTAPTASNFTLSNAGDVNGSGGTYVAYLFAHHDGDGTFGTTLDQDIIHCGYYTGDGSNTSFNIQDLGFEPQWLMAWPVNDFESRYILSTAIGFTVPLPSSDDQFLKADENSGHGRRELADLLPNGFKPAGTINTNTIRYNYIAIRKPMKTLVESGEDYYESYAGSDTQFDQLAFSPDTTIMFTTAGTYPTPAISTRKIGDNSSPRVFYMANDSDILNGYPNPNTFFETKEGNIYPGMYGNTGYRGFYFKERPGFLSSFGYRGQSPQGALGTYSKHHGLGARPEMIWLKSANQYYGNFLCWHKNMGGTTDSYTNKLYMEITESNGRATSNYWSYQTNPTINEETFTVGSNYDAVNATNSTYVGWAFGSVDGVSKVGSYSGTGTTQNIDCGFAATASAVLIKRADSTGHWLWFDKNHGGIATGTQSNAYRFDIGGGYVNTSNEDLNAYSSGFQLPSSAGDVNTNGGHYIFWAVA